MLYWGVGTMIWLNLMYLQPWRLTLHWSDSASRIWKKTLAKPSETYWMSIKFELFLCDPARYVKHSLESSDSYRIRPRRARWRHPRRRWTTWCCRRPSQWRASWICILSSTRLSNRDCGPTQAKTPSSPLRNAAWRRTSSNPFLPSVSLETQKLVGSTR